MKKRLLSSMLLGLCVAIGSAVPAMADSRKVVTLGNDLTQEQKDTMMRYFGVGYDGVDMMYITNADEREHLGSYVPLEQIGNYTYSCALVAPTSTGGIQVKTANLEWVTCNMIASTLSTSGVTNCQVVAASPFKVSGTGALTGVIMAYEQASQKHLEPQKVELANQELVTTGNLANQVGQSKATAVINETKIQVIENNVTNIEEINNIVTNVSNDFDVQINEDQSAEIAELMQKIAEQEYDITQLKATLDRVQANVIGDAGASEEEVKAAEEKAEASEQAAEEAAKQEAQKEQQTETQDEDGVVIAGPEETEETENILDNTDPGAFEGTGEVVEENDTTQSVQEQSEQKESENLGIPEATDDGTMTEAPTETEATSGDGVIVPETELQPGDGVVVPETELQPGDGVVVPETELQPGDGAIVPDTELQPGDGAIVPETELQPGDGAIVPETEVQPDANAEAAPTEKDLTMEDKAVYTEVKSALDEMFLTKELTFEDGTVVYLTDAAAKEVPATLDEYLLNLMVKGEGTVAAEEEADAEINKNIVQETAQLAPDKNYEDAQLKQADKFVRRLIFADSEKILAESQLEDTDKTLIYGKVMGILEKAYAPKDASADGQMTEDPMGEMMTEVPADGTAADGLAPEIPADGVTDEVVQDTGAVGDGTQMDQMQVPVDEFAGFEEEMATF